MKTLDCGDSIHGTFADNVCSIAPNVHSVVFQSSEINSFATNVGMHLNLKWFKSHRDLKIRSKSQFVTMFLQPKSLLDVWGYNGKATSLQMNPPMLTYTRLEGPFFGLGSTGAFHGKLNLLSGSSIFETCILPVFFLYSFMDMRPGCWTPHVFRL